MEDHIVLDMLRRIDTAVVGIQASMDNIEERVADHEARLRAMEQREDLSRRVDVLESKVESIQRLVWAWPATSLVLAAAAIVITALYN